LRDIHGQGNCVPPENLLFDQVIALY
jgi:hypothetical protein